MRKVCVYTATRAEYGLLSKIIKRVLNDENLELQLIVSGGHLDKSQGFSVQEIEEDKIPIAAKVEIYDTDFSKVGLLKSMGRSILKLADVLTELKPDIAVVLGDRYEILPFAQSCMMLNIPLAHIHGGEATEGLIDDAIRHSVTKMAHIHFPAAEAYKERLLKMGEEESRVFNFGAPGVENVLNISTKDELDLLEELDIKKRTKLFLFTYHPVTLYPEKTKVELEALLIAIDNYLKQDNDTNIVITLPNIENGSEFVRNKLIEYANDKENVYVYKNLGQLNYFSMLKISDLVIGNSSSGLIEVPSFKIPTINVGERQKGRLVSKSVIQTQGESTMIFNAIKKALSKEFLAEIEDAPSLYGEGDTSENIVQVLKTVDLENILYKKFYEC